MVGGTEMQTLMMVKALLAKHGNCQLPAICSSRTEADRAADTAKLNSGSQGELRSEVECQSSETPDGVVPAHKPQAINHQPSTINTQPTLGFSATVLCYFEHDAGMVEAFRKAGAEVVLLNLNRNIGAFGLILKLRTIFADLKPDILHIQYMAPGLLPIVAARLAGISNIVSTVHQSSTPYGPLPRLLLRLGASLCRRFVCVSAAAENSWFGERRCGLLSVDCGLEGKGSVEALGRGDVAGSMGAGESHSSRHLTIHNAVDIESIDRVLGSTDRDGLRRELGLEDVKVVGTVARLSPEKGIDLLIKAFVSVYLSNPAARLLIVGDGRERNALTKLTHDLELEDLVTWVGRQPWEKAIQHMSLMDVVVVPSRYEGFGLTAVEAMACSKPVVAFNHGSLAEVLGTGTPAILVAAGDVKAMSASIIALLTDYDLSASAGRSNRKRVEQIFGFDLFISRWQSLYHSLFSTYHSP